ncbi:MAG TPA: hypothetical protein VJH37_03885 [Candidatus Nanoarchaeia archaeon]|nr:hypothetical protein [Candidatus Nanoarchaeia archaeon]
MAERYASRFASSYEEDRKHADGRSLFSSKKGDNYTQLSRELIALGHRADAEDMLETVEEVNRRADFTSRRRAFLTHTFYVTLDKAIDAYKKGRLKEKQFNALLYKTQHQLSNALHESTPEELRERPFHSLRLTDIVNKEVLKQTAALVSFIFALLFFDQVRLTGAAIGAASGYDYYSLFGFLFLALGILLLLMRKAR